MGYLITKEFFELILKKIKKAGRTEASKSTTSGYLSLFMVLGLSGVQFCL